MAFYLRKIRNGRVKICKRWYRVCEHYQKYRGELDGLRYAFYTYDLSDLPDNRELYVCMWGPEKKFKMAPEEFENLTYEEYIGMDPSIVDGMLPWETWFETYNPTERR